MAGMTPVISPDIRALLPRVDTVIFDIDGVLLDVSQSIRAVNILSVPAYLRTLPGWVAPDNLLTSAEIERFKRAGGFNDDWDLTCAATLLFLYKSAYYGTRDAAALHLLAPTVEDFTGAISQSGGWLAAAVSLLQAWATPDEWAEVEAQYHVARILQIFQELWAGDYCPRLYGFTPQWYPGVGKVALDRPLLDRALVPAHLRLAALTGRTRNEATLALEMVGLATCIPVPDAAITKDDGFHKPDPGGMAALVTRLGCRVALYIGDTLDDLRTVLAFRDLPLDPPVMVLSAQVLTGTVGPDAPALFAPADLIAPDVNAVLRLLAGG